MTLIDHLQSKILGQADAVARFAKAVSRGEQLARSPASPRSISLLLGPTGVGKTEIILESGRFLYGDTYSGVSRLDMGEYSQANSVDRLKSPEKSPLLKGFQKMKDRESFFFHFDEIDKVHGDVLKLFLGINDAARLTLEDGQQLDFSACHIVFTGNIGGKEAVATDELPYESIEKNVLRAAEQWSSPELLQRFKNKVVFTGLSYEAQVTLCRRWLDEELRLQGGHLGRILRANESVAMFLLDRGYSKQYGARNLQNTIKTYIGDALLPIGRAPDDGDIFSGLLAFEVSDDYQQLIARPGSQDDLHHSLCLTSN